jgi:outer membrane protein insertion porin family
LIAVSEQQELIAEIQIHGNRRVPTNTIKALISTKPGDVYDPATIERDFNSLRNSGYFQDVRIEREQSERGLIIHFYLKEKPTAGDIPSGRNSSSR